MRAAGVIAVLALTACAGPPIETAAVAPEYRGIKTALLADDLVQFEVELAGGNGAEDVRAYADCAAAQYTLIRGYGFVRHVRTNLETSGGERGGVWRADAVYTVSPDLPSGRQTIDAVSRVRDCRAQGIPTV